ncbi:acetyl-CoA carboxylase biotin carboxyl carrier protein [Caldisalinibacter kiritimatiensis]|uniref:Biotin carboxyl carrier protein of acetyl-CoA carboxylase n=1 Tax=Caldisalinibacter kiritimatiensis TaxID=1304284 RepID=R1CFD7_9FIRM|nr:acetyl-CoA carboxylase biotin carboxyl carrier protein [Caldisalinibacter kiritimatiensis]EOD00985.1 Biotin carboxyl carrier protein of acetyl-CoA carboxylase [Caldisalinibacter kiritimatiensis]
MNIKEITELILTIDKTSIQKVEIEEKDTRISISKSAGNEPTYVEVNDTEIKTANIQQPIEEKMEEIEIAAVEEEDLFVVKSPIVGVYYEAPSPGADPFVKVGDKVNEGQTLCIIEAMKIMNEIESEVSGEIVEILVENEEVVEYGQPLMKIRR